MKIAADADAALAPRPLAQGEPSPLPQVPIMVWSGWNHFRIQIDGAMIREQAEAMASNGMKNAGYRFINIEDVFSGTRSFDVVHADSSLALAGERGEISRPIRKTGAGALTINRVVSGNASLTLDGGVLTLSAVNQYSGDTTVLRGQLVLTMPALGDASALTVTANGKVTLDFVGEDRVTKIILGATIHTAPGR